MCLGRKLPGLQLCRDRLGGPGVPTFSLTTALTISLQPPAFPGSPPCPVADLTHLCTPARQGGRDGGFYLDPARAARAVGRSPAQALRGCRGAGVGGAGTLGDPAEAASPRPGPPEIPGSASRAHTHSHSPAHWRAHTRPAPS